MNLKYKLCETNRTHRQSRGPSGTRRTLGGNFLEKNSNLARVEYLNNIIKTIAPIWRENVLKYLSAYVSFSEELTVFRERSCELQGTNNVQGQISEHIFIVKWKLLCYYPSNIVCHTRDLLKIKEYPSEIPQF